MPRTLLPVLLFLLHFNIQAQETKGRVYAEDKPLEGVLIINKTQDVMVATQSQGGFKIAAKLGDSLIFSYSFFETQIHKVEAYQLEEIWVVELKENRNELDAVTVIAPQKVEDFDVEAYDKTFNFWLKKDIRENPDKYRPASTGSGIDFIAVGKMVWNLLKKEKKKKTEVEAEKFRALRLGELEAFFREDAFFNQELLRDQLKISKEEAPLFFDYCLHQDIDARLLQEKNQMQFLDLLLKKSADFHSLNEAN